GECPMAVTTAVATTRSNSGLTVVLGVAALLIAAGAAVYFTSQNSHPAAPVQSVPVSALYGIAIDAEGAVAGTETSFTSFTKQLQELKDAAVTSPGAPFTKDARFSRLLTNAAAVAQARGALMDASSAARDARDLVPRLLSEAGSLSSGLSGASLEAV